MAAAPAFGVKSPRSGSRRCGGNGKPCSWGIRGIEVSSGSAILTAQVFLWEDPALAAMDCRCSGESDLARAGPPFSPPLWPRSLAASFREVICWLVDLADIVT